MVDGGDDLVFRVWTILHERAAHARHRRILVGLATAGPGWLEPVLFRADLVMQIRLQNAVFDHHSAAGLVAFIVIVQRAAFARNRRLINHGHEWFGDLLADHVGVDTRALAVKVGFHAVTNRLVQENAAGPGRQDHRHLAIGRTPCFKLDHCAIDRLFDHFV